MYLHEYYLIFPDGEQVETETPPNMRALLDVNGEPHPLPLKSEKTLAYRICGKRTREQPGITAEFYILEQMSAEELTLYVG